MPPKKKSSSSTPTKRKASNSLSSSSSKKSNLSPNATALQKAAQLPGQQKISALLSPPRAPADSTGPTSDSIQPVPSSSPASTSAPSVPTRINIGVVKQDASDGPSNSTSPLSCSPFLAIEDFDPDTLPYYWRSGEANVPYRWLADAFQLVDGNKGRIVITRILTNMLRTIIRHSPDELLSALYLCSNCIGPSYEGVETGIGSGTLVKIAKSITDHTSKTLKASYDEKGDWGDVLFNAKKQTQMLMKPKPLTVAHVYSTLRKIASLSGTGSENAKTRLVSDLLTSAQGEELRYLTRTLIANLRIGATKTTVMHSLARALVMESDENIRDEPYKDSLVKKAFSEAEAILRECWAQCPNYHLLVPKLLDPQIGLTKTFDACKCRPGIPIVPMLGKVTKDIPELFAKVEGQKFCADFKFDGQRAQIHLTEDGTISIYSRHLENMTEKYPDIVASVPQFASPTTSSFIIDAEIVAWDDGKVLPFQTLANRQRKNVNLQNINVQVCVLMFDVMYLNKESLVRESFRARRDAMRGAFVEVPGKFGFVPQKEMADIEELQDYLKLAIDSSCEGLMVKVLDPPATPHQGRSGAILSTYEPDKRTDSWLKLKKDYVDGLADSFDCVPIAAWVGNGRKVHFWSPVLLAVYNPETEMLEAFCKCMSGFDETFYKEMKDRYALGSDKVIPGPKSYYSVPDSLHPDVWFAPTDVWEIRGADITLSPVYTAGLGKVNETRGMSLRFPRFVRVRDDKNVEDASTPEMVEAMYGKYAGKGTEKGKGKGKAKVVEQEEDLEDVDDVEEGEEEEEEDGGAGEDVEEDAASLGGDTDIREDEEAEM